MVPCIRPGGIGPPLGGVHDPDLVRSGGTGTPGGSWLSLPVSFDLSLFCRLSFTFCFTNSVSPGDWGARGFGPTSFLSVNGFLEAAFFLAGCGFSAEVRSRCGCGEQLFSCAGMEIGGAPASKGWEAPGSETLLLPSCIPWESTLEPAPSSSDSDSDSEELDSEELDEEELGEEEPPAPRWPC